MRVTKRRGAELEAIFSGTLRSEITCGKCGCVSTKYEDFQDLSLDLAGSSSASELSETLTPSLPSAFTAGCRRCVRSCLGRLGVRISLATAPTAGDSHDPMESFTLESCLRSFTRIEHLGAGEKCWCEACSELQESTKRMSIHRLPNVLCVHLKRFKQPASCGKHGFSKQTATKIDSFVEFPLHSLAMGPHSSGCLYAEDSEAVATPEPSQLFDLFGA